MKLLRRNFLYLAAGAAALPALSRIAKAQAYPTRPVRLIVGTLPPGIGSTPHVSAELFNMMSGINMIHVPYRIDVLAEIT